MSNNGGAEMPITIEKARLNIWNIGTAFFGIAVTAFGWGMTWNSMSAQIEALKNQAARDAQITKEQGVRTDNRIQAVEIKIPQFEVIALQIQRLTEISAQNEKAIDAANKRMDRIVESQSGKLDKIITSVSDLTTEVRVIQSQIKEQDKAQRTRFPVTQPFLRGK